jgi:FG-GAP repeat/Bacterial Ig domain
MNPCADRSAIRPLVLFLLVLAGALLPAACGGGGGGSSHKGGGGNHAPVAQSFTVNTLEDLSVGVTLTATDADEDALTYAVTGPPGAGTLSGTSPALTYLPNRNVNGTDSFTYVANDGKVDSAPATVTLSVEPVNDPPWADDQSLSTGKQMPLAITLSGGDLEDDPLTFVVTGGPFDGRLSGTPPDLTYTPAAGYLGVDAFSFRASDGTDASGAATVFISVYDATAPADVAGFTATGEDGQVLLAWRDPTDADLDGVMIRRSTSAFPASPADGSLVLEAPVGMTSLVDGSLTNGRTYYYAAFAYDDAGNFANGVTASAQTHAPFTLEDAKRLAPSAYAGSQFGFAVAINGDDAVVGAPGTGTGSAYLFHRDPYTRIWDDGALLQTRSGAFGTSVAISGDYTVVGAPLEDVVTGGNFPEAGAVYVFHRNPLDGQWDAGVRLVAPDYAAMDYFGTSVAISGDHVIVGAPGHYFEQVQLYDDAGAAYVFRRTGPNAWDTGSELWAYDAQANDQFGISVAISGDYAIVGAWYEDGETDTLTDAGAAYVFQRTGTTAWSAGPKLTAPDTQAHDQFGISVAISGDYAIVGANLEDGGAGDPLSAAGAAYVFRRTGPELWDTGVRLEAYDAVAGDQFGWSVAISGDAALVGAYLENVKSTPVDSGAAYLFRRTGLNAWEGRYKLTASDAQAYDNFGYSVGISSDAAIVGAPGEDGGAGDPLSNTGAAYLFR